MDLNKLLKQAEKKWCETSINRYLLYPNENVIRYLYKVRKKFNSICDFGCGNGRHTEAMAIAGFKNIVAVDCNSELLDIVKKRLENFDISLMTYENDITNSFSFKDIKKVDCILAWGSLFYNTESEIIKLISNLSESINISDGGELFANWRTQDDWLYKHGEEINKNTFLIKNTQTHDNFVYYFPTIKDLKEIYKKAGMKILSIEKEEFTEDNMHKINSWYNVLAKKI